MIVIGLKDNGKCLARYQEVWDAPRNPGEDSQCGGPGFVSYSITLPLIPVIYKVASCVCLLVCTDVEMPRVLGETLYPKF